MQHRMKTHPLTQKQIAALLREVDTGTLATLNEDGSPYATPVHFVYLNEKIYIHGLPKGKKIDNIARRLVSFTAYRMDQLLLDAEGKPCDTNTQYQSVIANGTAAIVEDLERKQAVLEAIVAKYTPQLQGRELPSNMVKGTAVIEITATAMTGKYYD